MRYVFFLIALLFLVLTCTVAWYYWQQHNVPDSTGPEPSGQPHESPEPEKQIRPGDKLYLRLLKTENRLEIWFRSESKTYELYKAYPICTFSGGLGPKKLQGDLKSPEGFYATDKGKLNPNSRYHLSFNIGYPNAYDHIHGYTGDFLMIHGGCVSAGCYAMTDPIITEIYALVEQAINSGQKSIPIHIFPFAMTQQNMNNQKNSPHLAFWQSLKPAYDYFEKYHRVPTVVVEGKRYRLLNSED